MRQQAREHGESKFRFPHHSRIGASGSVFTRFWWRERDFDCSMTYSEKLKDPRWQRKRLEILQRDDFMCLICQDSAQQLHVHHKQYRRGADPWDYPDSNFVTLCCECHENVKAIQEFVSHMAGFEPAITTLSHCVFLLNSPWCDEFWIVIGVFRNNPSLLTQVYKSCLKNFSTGSVPNPDSNPSPDPERKQ